MIVTDIHQNVLKVQEGIASQNNLVCAQLVIHQQQNARRFPIQVSDTGYRGVRVLVSRSIALGESPPPVPRDCFGRDELVEKVVGLAESLKPITLIGAGGIGKASIPLTVLHHDRIKRAIWREPTIHPL